MSVGGFDKTDCVKWFETDVDVDTGGAVVGFHIMLMRDDLVHAPTLFCGCKSKDYIPDDDDGGLGILVYEHNVVFYN